MRSAIVTRIDRSLRRSVQHLIAFQHTNTVHLVMKPILLACCIAISFSAMAQKASSGIFENSTDVGHPKVKGSTVYDKQSDTYTIAGGGYNIWFNRDEFQYAYKELKGDFVLTAKMEFVGEGKEAHRKIGWMVRASLADTAVHISAVQHGDGLTVLQWREKPGMNMRDPEDEIRAKEQKQFAFIQLERKGNNFIMRVADKKDAPFVLIGEHTMQYMPKEILAGIFICSHNADVMETAKVSEVRIRR